MDEQQLSDRDLLVRVDANVTNLTSLVGDHENRIRKLEKALYIGIGFSAAVGSAIGSAAGTLLG